MIKLSRTAAAAAVGGGVIASVVTFGITQDFTLAGSNANPNSNSNANATPTPKSLVVTQTGSTPVAPGKAGSITLSVRNPNNQAVILTDVTTTVTSIGSGTNSKLPTCNKTWISIAPWSGARQITANGTTSVTVAATFDNQTTVNQDNCKDVAFTFSFTATGRQA